MLLGYSGKGYTLLLSCFICESKDGPDFEIYYFEPTHDLEGNEVSVDPFYSEAKSKIEDSALFELRQNQDQRIDSAESNVFFERVFLRKSKTPPYGYGPILSFGYPLTVGSSVLVCQKCLNIYTDQDINLILISILQKIVLSSWPSKNDFFL
jgi:hypothetical protein